MEYIVMAKTYYFGDLHCVLGSDVVSHLFDTISEHGNSNNPFAVKLGNKEIFCLINKTQHGNGEYNLVDFDINNVTHILFKPQPSEIHVYYGTLGLICLDQLVHSGSGSDGKTSLSKLIKDIKTNEYGLLFQIDSDSDEPVLIFENKYGTFYHQVKLGNEVLFQTLT